MSPDRRAPIVRSVFEIAKWKVPPVELSTAFLVASAICSASSLLATGKAQVPSSSAPAPAPEALSPSPLVGEGLGRGVGACEAGAFGASPSPAALRAATSPTRGEVRALACAGTYETGSKRSAERSTRRSSAVTPTRCRRPVSYTHLTL